MLGIVYYFSTHSSEFVTHIELVGVAVGISSATLGGFITMWLKLTDFAKELGEIKGIVSRIK